MNFIIAILKAALAFTMSLIKGFNPLRNHLPTDRSETGGSTFLVIKDMEDWFNLISTASDIEQVPGKNNATCYIFRFAKRIIGYFVWTEVTGDCVLRYVHKHLQPVGPFIRHEEETTCCTAALTDEHTGKYALASCYPGEPDDSDEDGAKTELKEMGFDWVEGTVIPKAIVEKYHLRVRSEAEVDPA